MKKAKQNDPKYKFTDGGVWHVEGGYMLPSDEPMMLFRGKDQLAVRMCEIYLEILEDEVQTDIVKSHIVTARERLEAFKLFHKMHPKRIGVCCSTTQKATL